MSKLTDEQKERYKLKPREKRAANRKQSKSDITCRLCNVILHVKGMPVHLSNVHNVTFDHYLEQYLDDFRQFRWTCCPICDKITQGTTCSKKCYAVWKSKPENIIGITPGWNKGLTKDTSDALKRMGENVSKANTNNPKRMGANNPASRPEVRDKISHTRIERGVAKGEKNPMYGKTHTADALRKIFDKRSMTKPERIMKELLDDSNVRYTPQFFITSNGQTYSYDFYLPDHRVIIEVDGDYWHGGPGVAEHWYGVNVTKDTDQRKDAVALDHGYTVLRVWESELNGDKKLIMDILQQL